MQEEKDKAQTTINKTEGWYPVARSGLFVPSAYILPTGGRGGGGAGDKMFYISDWSDAKYTEESM